MTTPTSSVCWGSFQGSKYLNNKEILGSGQRVRMGARFGKRWNVQRHGPLEPAIGRRFTMTRLFLAAGVAALAIAMPASAKPGEHGGGKGGGGAAAAAPNRGGGNFRAPSGGGGGFQMRMQRAPRGGGGFQMRAAERHGGNFAAPRAQRQAFSFERGRGHAGGFAAPRAQRQSFASTDRGHGHARNVAQVQRQHGNAVRMTGGERRMERGNVRSHRVEQARNFERQRGRPDR